MPVESAPLSALQFYPLTVDRWADLEKLFGPRGAFSGCWCMWWHLKRDEFWQGTAKNGTQNKQALKNIVDSGRILGILAYSSGAPVGWCSLAPREQFSALERSRKLKRIDDQPVWSVVCFFIAKPFRQQGLMSKLLAAAVDCAREHGARIVEGYPKEPLPSVRPASSRPTASPKASL